MSEGQNKSYDSDKENITPYRYTHSIISSYFEDKDVSVLSEVSDYLPNKHNSTTTALNRILEGVHVNDPSHLNRSDDLVSEVSFDLASEPEKADKETPAAAHNEDKKAILFDSTIETAKKDKVASPDKDQTNQNCEAKTPNLRRNPFEISSIDHFPEISPNVFIQRETDEFKWSIEHMSEMNPADISGDQPSYILEAQKKEYNDDTHQQTVTTYFKTRIIAPSPCVSKSPSTPLYNGDDKACQTNISLPFNFDLESILGEEYLSTKAEKPVSDNSFRRMLFESETPGRGDGGEVRELSEPDYIEELQSSPVIKAVNFSPLSGSDYPPSFEICNDENNPLNGSLLSPINSNSKPFSNFRTPARLNSPAAGMQSTPGPGYQANTPGFHGYQASTPGFHGAHVNTPGRPRHAHHIMMSTPGPAHTCQADDLENAEAKTPASSSKRRLTPDKNPLFKNSQFTSPFISPIPKSLSYIKRHPKCPKKSRHDAPNGSPRKRHGDGVTSPADSPGDMLSPASSAPSPASSETSPDALIAKHIMPMESSRIESGTDVSSDGEREKTKLIMQLGIQPLDISEIKPQDNSQKLRTNNYLDISDKPDNASYSPSTTNTCCNNTCCHGNNTCQGKDDVRSKDSGFGTSSAMSTMATSTLPPLSENSNILAMDSRPGKRKKYECNEGEMNDSGLQPPPVKRVVIATQDNTAVPMRRKHWSLD